MVFLSYVDDGKLFFLGLLSCCGLKHTKFYMMFHFIRLSDFTICLLVFRLSVKFGTSGNEVGYYDSLSLLIM